jgi:hypothetical protein
MTQQLGSYLIKAINRIAKRASMLYQYCSFMQQTFGQNVAVRCEHKDQLIII